MGESPNEEDTYQQFIQNDFEYKDELINFYNSISTSWNEQNLFSQETGLDQNITSYSGISNNSIINSEKILLVDTGVDTFDPSLQAQMEGNAQVSNFIPMVDEVSQNQGSNQPLDVPNSSLNTNVQTPNQASIQLELSENYEKIKAKLRTPSTINELISRENEIQSQREKREKYRINKKNGNNKALHELRIGNFEEGLEKLFEGIQRGKWQRSEKGQKEKIKIFKIRKVKRKRRGQT